MASHENREAAFVARITAGATHEFRNVLAIIKESAGLIEDLVSLGSRGGGPDLEKVQRAVNRIRAQVDRGAALMTALNRFAHLRDQPEGPRDLQEEVCQVVFLSQRYARPGRHRLLAGDTDQRIPVSLDALRLHMALFAAVRCGLERVPPDGTVTLSAGWADGRAVVAVAGSVEGEADIPAAPEAGEWAGLVEVVEGLGGSVELLEDGWGFRLVLPEGARA